MTGRNQFEESEYWVYMQQRFEAALKFATTPDPDGYFITYDDAIKQADRLLAKLEETRTKTSEEETPSDEIRF